MARTIKCRACLSPPRRKWTGLTQRVGWGCPSPGGRSAFTTRGPGLQRIEKKHPKAGWVTVYWEEVFTTARFFGVKVVDAKNVSALCNDHLGWPVSWTTVINSPSLPVPPKCSPVGPYLHLIQGQPSGPPILTDDTCKQNRTCKDFGLAAGNKSFGILSRVGKCVWEAVAGRWCFTKEAIIEPHSLLFPLFSSYPLHPRRKWKESVKPALRIGGLPGRKTDAWGLTKPITWHPVQFTSVRSESI